MNKNLSIIADLTDCNSMYETQYLITQARDLGINGILLKKQNLRLNYTNKYLVQHEYEQLDSEQLTCINLQDLRNQIYRYGMKFGCYITDTESIDFMETLDPDFYYIPENDFENIILIKYVIEKNRSFFLSVSYNTSFDVIKKVLSFIKDNINSSIPFVLLYDSRNDKSLSMQFLNNMIDLYPYYNLGYIGFDTVLPSLIAIEKGINVVMHPLIKNESNKKGLTVDNFKQLMLQIETLKSIFENIEETNKSKILKKYIHIEKNLKKNQIITYHHLTVRYAIDGISAIYLKDIIGCLSKRELKKDDSLSWDDVHII